ncbi:Crp/Fnr family transcriptional regulator [Variovorax sp. GB1P17]|uniref:Crp/Fnr family transcriptional regulator n=1 Tax=Variovorax sp. GB1P17 TaxID=3443740 RepID=UPI003F456E71
MIGPRKRNSAADLMLMERALRATQAFSPWPLAAMSHLLSSSYVGRHPRGHVLSSELNPVAETFLIISGEVMAARVWPAGERFVVMLLGQGVVMGLTQVFGKADRTAFDFSAHNEVVAVHMPTPLIVETLDKEPALWKEMALMMLGQHAAHVRTLRSQIEGSLRRRVASTIERLAALYGAPVAGGGAVVRLQISQASLATLLQANRQAVNRELKALAASGSIGLEYNAMTVRDPEALGHVANPPR